MATTPATTPTSPATAQPGSAPTQAAPAVTQPAQLPSSPQPWTQQVTTPSPLPVANATPGLLGPTNTATAATNSPTLLSNQIQTVTDPNSPIMQRAVAAANESSNDKGLLNSSMAVGAAQNAVYNAALPIATGDINALNTAGLATQQQESQASLSNAQQANAMQTAQAQLTSQANLQNAQAQNTQIMAQLGQANQIQLNALGNQYQSFLNSNQNASTLYNNTLAQIGNIQSNPNIDAATKTAQIQQLMTYLESGLSMMSATSGLNLSAGLNFGTPAKTGTTTGSNGLLAATPGGLSSLANPAPAPASTPTTAPKGLSSGSGWHGHGLKPR